MAKSPFSCTILLDQLDLADDGYGLLLAVDGADETHDPANQHEDAPNKTDEGDEGQQAEDADHQSLVGVELAVLVADEDGNQQADPGNIGNNVGNTLIHEGFSFQPQRILLKKV